MKVAISGASGFVGSSLRAWLQKEGHETVPLGVKDFAQSDESFTEKLDGCEVVINLAGAPIIARWSEEYKKILYSSRIDTTRKLARCISSLDKKPRVFISTSAVGIYANDRVYDEENIVYGENFLADLCRTWEHEAFEAKSEETRVVVFRFGIVLGRDGGALKQMLPIFRLGLGGRIGSGKQGFSWVHLDDLTRAFAFAVEREDMSGAYNLTAPQVTTNEIFTAALSEVLRRPAIFPVPAFALRLLYSQGAQVLTDGQHAVPKRLLEHGFEFEHPEIIGALEHLLAQKSS